MISCTRPIWMFASVLVVVVTIIVLIVLKEESQIPVAPSAASTLRPDLQNERGVDFKESMDASARLLWRDEFVGDNLNQEYWTCDSEQAITQPNYDGDDNIVQNRPLDPVGTDLEFYDPHVVTIKDGMLVISPRQVNNAGVPFVSGRIKTQDKIEFQYGTVEARIRIQSSCRHGVDVCVSSLNLSPSFWTRGSGSTSYGEPTMGQVDIFSAALPSLTRRRRLRRNLKHGSPNKQAGPMHHESKRILMASNINSFEPPIDFDVGEELDRHPWMGHSGASWIASTTTGSGGERHFVKKSFHDDFPMENWMDQDFQIYKFDWTPSRMATYIDDELVWEMDITEGSCKDCQDFHRPHYVLLAISVLDSPLWVSSSTSATMDLSVDYVRLFDNGFAKVSILP